MKYFKEISILSEADLPKEEDNYVAYYKDGRKGVIRSVFIPGDSYLINQWLANYASYLSPVPVGVLYEKVTDEIPTVGESFTFYIDDDLPVIGVYNESEGNWWVTFENNNGDTENFSLSDFKFWLRPVQ